MASRTLAEHGVESFKHRVGEMAHDLRKLADRIEREANATRSSRVNTMGEYHYRTQRILHEVTWAVANLGLDGLIQDASYADDRGDGDD